MRQVLLIHPESDWITVEVPSLPGCISQGRTVDEALANIRDAIQGYINDMIAAGEEVPPDFAPLQLVTVAA